MPTLTPNLENNSMSEANDKSITPPEATASPLVIACQEFLALRKEWLRQVEFYGPGVPAKLRALQADMKPHRLLICKTPATTGVELFWKARAASGERFPSCEAGRSVAADLVNSPDFRRLLWPADVGEA
jgi:hypothetical protein